MHHYPTERTDELDDLTNLIGEWHRLPELYSLTMTTTTDRTTEAKMHKETRKTSNPKNK